MNGDGDSAAPFRVSPLYASHLELGAKMVPFGGWEMPLAYPSGTVAEHRACRTSAVAFDVSHLGTVRVRGADAFEHLQHSLSNDLTRIHPGRAQYTHLLDDDGFVVDDIIVWWVDDERFDVMPNASNTTDVVAAIGGIDVTDERAVIAIQGPRGALSPGPGVIGGRHRPSVRRRSASSGPAPRAWSPARATRGRRAWNAPSRRKWRTDFWQAVLAQGVAPAGLGARDTLRLEAGLPLHGHELGPGITPLQAGLGWVIGWDKGDFTGRAALEEERANGPARRLRGFVADGRQPLRDGSLLCEGVEQVGILTSGNFSPMRERGIGLGFVEADARLLDGDAITIVQRGRELPARLVRPPLWPIREDEENE